MGFWIYRNRDNPPHTSLLRLRLWYWIVRGRSWILQEYVEFWLNNFCHKQQLYNQYNLLCDADHVFYYLNIFFIVSKSGLSEIIGFTWQLSPFFTLQIVRWARILIVYSIWTLVFSCPRQWCHDGGSRRFGDIFSSFVKVE